MTIEPILLVATLIGGALVFAIGVFLGRMIGRPVSETSLRETFRALSHEALKSNNESFLSLAETKLGEARAKAAAEIDQRKAAIENLLTPMAKTLGEVDRELRESERPRPAVPRPRRTPRRGCRSTAARSRTTWVHWLARRLRRRQLARAPRAARRDD